AQRAAINAEVGDDGIAVRKARLPERRHGDAVVEVERVGQDVRLARLQVLRVKKRLTRQPGHGVAGAGLAHDWADERQRIGAGEKRVAALDLQDAVKDQIDDVVAILVISEQRIIEARWGREGAEEL